jgi:archaetidylinositol phosphate synthase
LLVSYSRARAEAAGLKMESIGLAERAERIIILTAATLVAVFWQPATVMNWSIIIIALLATFTVIQRAYYVYTELKK